MLKVYECSTPYTASQSIDLPNKRLPKFIPVLEKSPTENNLLYGIYMCVYACGVCHMHVHNACVCM